MSVINVSPSNEGLADGRAKSVTGQAISTTFSSAVTAVALATTYKNIDVDVTRYEVGDASNFNRNSKVTITNCTNAANNGEYACIKIDEENNYLYLHNSNGVLEGSPPAGALASYIDDKVCLDVNLVNTGGTGVEIQGSVAHDEVDAGNPLKIGGRARETQIDAVAEDDRVDAIFNKYGEQINAGHNYPLNAGQIVEMAPINNQYEPGKTVLTNIAANTTDYLYYDMSGKKYAVFQIKTSGAAPTDVLTLTFEVTCQDDGTVPGSCDYIDATFDLFGINSLIDSDGLWVIDIPLGIKYGRIKYNTSNTGGNDADLTVYSKLFY